MGVIFSSVYSIINPLILNIGRGTSTDEISFSSLAGTDFGEKRSMVKQTVSILSEATFPHTYSISYLYSVRKVSADMRYRYL